MPEVHRSTITLAAFSDSHIFTKRQADSLAEHVTDVDRDPGIDVIVHGGDFTDRGSIEGATYASEAFANSSKKKIGVKGNHDRVVNSSTYQDVISEMLVSIGGITLLDGTIEKLKTKEGSINITGVTGYSEHYRAQSTKIDLGVTDEEYTELVSHDFHKLNEGVANIPGKENILLLHFPFTPLKKGKNSSKKIRYKELEINGNGNEPHNIEEIVYKAGEKFSLILFGHVHSPEYPTGVSLQHAEATNISSPITITMSAGVPYRLIEVPIQNSSSTND